MYEVLFRHSLVQNNEEKKMTKYEGEKYFNSTSRVHDSIS